MKKSKTVKIPLSNTPPQRPRPYALILFLFTFVLYSNTILNDYNLDDELVTRKHPLTSQGIKAIPDILTSPYFKMGGTAYEYRPVVLISFALEHQFLGESPLVSHFFNVLLYALSILLLFLTLKKLFHAYNVLLPFAITLLFAAHPLHTEVVASIKNRDEILAFLFAILSLFTAIHFIEKSKAKYLIISFTTFILALLSKSSIIPFALIIPMSLFFFTRASNRQILFISFGLSLASGFLAPFSNFSYKVLFAFLVFISPFIINLLLNKRSYLLDYWRIIKSNIKTNTESPAPIFNFSVLVIALLVILAVLLCGIGAFYNFRLLFYIVLLGLVVLYYASDIISGQYFFSTFIFIVSLVSINYKQAHILAFCLVLTLFMYFFVDKKPKKYLILSLLFIFIPWVTWSGLEGAFWIIYITFIMWGSSVQKFRIYAIGLIVLFFISSPLVSYLRHMEMLRSGHLFSFIALSITLFLFFRLKNYKPALLFLFVIIPLALAVKLSSMSGSYSIVVEKYFNPATNINIGTKILPASGRALDLVEMPLNNSTPLSVKIGTGLYVTAEYLLKLIFPYKLGFYYGYRFVEPQSWYNLQSVVSFIVHFSLLFLALLYYKKEKLLLFAVLYYMATVSLFSNIVAPLPGLMADRFAYVPSLGFSIFLAFIMFSVFKVSYTATYIDFKKHKGLLLLMGFIVMFYSVRTFLRNKDWENHLTLFRNDITYLDKSAQAHNLLATNLNIYSKQEKNTAEATAMKEEAIVHYRRALEIYPDFFNASYDISRTFAELKMPDSALVYFKNTIKIRPEFFDPYLQLAFIYHQKDSISLALEYYNKTLELKKNIPNVYRNLTAIYFSQNKIEKVIDINRKYNELAQGQKEPLINIAKAYYLNTQYDSAYVYFKEIIAIDAADTDAIMAMIELCSKTNKKEELAFYKNKLAEITKKFR